LAWFSIAVLGAVEAPGQWQTITTREGLPHDDVLAIHVADEHVWVGTAGGLARWDGVAWRQWTTAEGLPWQAISAIDVDTQTGAVWLGTRGGGLFRLSGERFDRFDQLNSGLAGNLVFSVAIEDHLVWVATNGGLSVLDTLDDRWDLHFERRADAQTALTALILDDRGLHAAGWCEPLRRLDRQQRTWSITAESAAAVAVTSSGNVWWATQRDLLGPADGAIALRIPGVDAPGRLVTCLAAGHDGAVAVGTNRGLEVLLDRRTPTWVRHARGGVAGLPDQRIRCVAFQDDVLWVGTARGLARGPARGTATVNDRAITTPVSPAAAASPLRTVNIGLLRPDDRTISLPGGAPQRGGLMDLLAVHLAIEHANAAGGYRGQVPFGFATGPEGAFKGWGWTLPEDDFPALAEQPDVWGIVGNLQPGARITTVVALQTEIPLVNCAATRPTMDETLNPWIFRLPGGDEPGTERRFVAAYQARFGRPPPPGAFGLYAAVRHLLEAIEEAGLDREAIRTELHDKNGP
jgi:hypothetical protein